MTQLEPTSSEEGSERALVSAVAVGDPQAFEQLYRLYQRRVFRYLSSIVRDPATAEELTVDTMLAVWHSASRYQRASRVSTWLLGIARHKALDALRRKGRLASTSPLEDAAELPAMDHDPLDVAEARSTEEVTRRAFDCLSSAHREVLYLAFFADTPYEQIATLLAIPQNTVKTRVYYAKQRLREQLERLTTVAAVR